MIKSMRSFLIGKYLYYDSVNYFTDKKREWRLAKSGMHMHYIMKQFTVYLQLLTLHKEVPS